jgi:electron transfer flavoprotein beta subunit
VKAKRMRIESVTPQSLGVMFARHSEITRYERPAVRQAGCRVQSVDELVDRLRTEAQVI